MSSPTSVSGDSAIDFYYARIQSDFLVLHLQLAEFETTYKTKSGEEIEVTRSPDGKFASKSGSSNTISTSTKKNKSDPPLISQETDNAISKSFLSEAGEKLKAGLISAVAEHPEIAKGIKDTKIEDVIKGTKDTFGNAVDFMHSQIDKAANAVSENQEELAIGAAVVGLGVVGAVLGLAIATTAAAVIGDSIAGVIAGRTLSRAAQFALKRLSVDRVKDLVKVMKLPVAIATGVSVVNTIGNVKKQVQKVKAYKADNTIEVDGVTIRHKGKAYKLPNGGTVTAT